MPAGKLGRLPRDTSIAVPHFEDYLEAGGVLPLPNVSYRADVDYATSVSSWPMYCNGPDPENALVCPGSPDGCGDCVWAYQGHAIQAWTRYNAVAEVTLPASSIIAGYATTGYDPQTGANDNGTDIGTALRYMMQQGLADATGKVHKIAGYALFRDPHNQELLAQGLDIGGTLCFGANMQQAQMDQTNAGQPWDYVAGSPEIGGHCFGFQQRRGSGTHKLVFVTWGQLQQATDAFLNHCVDEVYYVVSEDDIALNGTNRAGFKLAQLLADMPQFS